MSSILNIYYRETLDKIDSYREYINELKKVEDKMWWGKATNKNTKKAYEKYLMNYYNGIYSNEAKTKVDEFNRFKKEKELEEQRIRDIEIVKEKEAWELVCKKNTKEDYENYLKFYPRGIYCYEAESEISKINRAEETILWVKVSQQDNEVSYTKFLNKYPNGMYSEEAQKYLEEVSFEITRDCDDYRFFIFFDNEKKGIRVLNKEAKTHNHYFTITISPEYYHIKSLSNGLLLVENQHYEEALFTRAGYEIFKFGKYRLVEDKGENKTNIIFNKDATDEMSFSFIKHDKQVIYNEKFIPIFDNSVKKIIDTRNLTFGYIGGDEELLIKPVLEYVSLLKNGLGIAKIKNTKYHHLINSNYQIILSNVNYIESEFINGLSIYERDNQFGIINEKGEVLTDSSFNNIILTKVGISIYQESGHYGLLTSEKRIRANGVLDFNRIVFIEKEELFVLDDGYIGFVNNKGKITIPCEIEKHCFNDFNDTYQELFDRNEFIKVVTKNGKVGLINNKGEYQIQPLYDRLDDSKDKKVFLVGIEDRVGFIDINGKILLKIDKYEMARFAEKVTRIKKDNLYGLVNWEIGKIILPIKYNSMSCEYLKNNIYKFASGLKSGLIDENGKIILDLVNILKFNSLKKEFLK